MSPGRRRCTAVRVNCLRAGDPLGAADDVWSEPSTQRSPHARVVNETVDDHAQLTQMTTNSSPKVEGHACISRFDVGSDAFCRIAARSCQRRAGRTSISRTTSSRRARELCLRARLRIFIRRIVRHRSYYRTGRCLDDTGALDESDDERGFRSLPCPKRGQDRPALTTSIRNRTSRISMNPLSCRQTKRGKGFLSAECGSF
jgi:hypothetical protein